ncbi:MAG TPA: hypothetical protein VLQ90_09190, partial [Pyrinomonadaceae bacterium]|nr:hypothetical protein [Pyrinomonadaceae bacterium]
AAPAQNATQTTESKESPINLVPAPTDSPKAAESKTEKSSQRVTTTKPATEKSPENSLPSKSQIEKEQEIAHDPNRNSDRGNPNSPPSQNQRPFDPMRNPQGRQPGHPPGPGEMPTVRTLRNGTRVVTQPDGTRIMTGPNGRVQVIPPGEKPIRRRGRP